MAWISAINLGEVIDVMTRIFGRGYQETMDALVLLESGGLRIADVNADLGIDAGRLHAKHYHRTSSPLSMADCVALATALMLREPMATADPPLAAAAHAEGLTVVGLPDSEGRRPEN